MSHFRIARSLRNGIFLRLLVDFHPSGLTCRLVPGVVVAPVLPFILVGEVYVEDFVAAPGDKAWATRSSSPPRSMFLVLRIGVLYG